MESLPSYTTLKDGFKITISKSDTELNIEAENQETGNTFSSKFTDGTIKKMSLELFENILDLFEGLVTAFKGLSEDPSVKVDPDGTILFTQKLNMGKQEKSLNFPIRLDPAEANPMNRLEKVMIKVLKEVEGLREEVKGLNNHVFELNRENRQLQEKLAMDYYEIIYPTFDVSDAFAKKFEISKDKRTATLISNESEVSLCSGTILPREKSSKFRVKIDNGSSSHLAIGVAVKGVMKNNSLKSPGTYYLLGSSYVCLNGSSRTQINNNRPILPDFAIVGVQYIPSRNEIRFDINGEHTYMTIIDGAYQKLDIFPIVNVPSRNTKVSFI